MFQKRQALLLYFKTRNAVIFFENLYLEGIQTLEYYL